MKPASVFLLLFSCVIAGLSGAILYNYSTLHAAKKQLLLLESDLEQYNKLIADAELRERALSQPKQITPLQAIPVDSASLSPKQRYLMQIIAKIQLHWFVDDSMRGKECRVNIKLAQDGILTSATPLGGDYNLCASALTAIKQASPFQVSSDPDVYDALKDLTVILRPELR